MNQLLSSPCAPCPKTLQITQGCTHGQAHKFLHEYILELMTTATRMAAGKTDAERAASPRHTAIDVAGQRLHKLCHCLSTCRRQYRSRRPIDADVNAVPSFCMARRQRQVPLLRLCDARCRRHSRKHPCQHVETRLSCTIQNAHCWHAPAPRNEMDISRFCTTIRLRMLGGKCGRKEVCTPSSELSDPRGRSRKSLRYSVATEADEWRNKGT